MTKFNPGDRVSFTYLKQIHQNHVGGHFFTDYVSEAENYLGEVLGVRDIVEQPLLEKTWKTGKPKGKRSQQLVTLQLANGDVKSFYDGRIVAPKRIEQPLVDLLASVVKVADSFVTAI